MLGLSLIGLGSVLALLTATWAVSVVRDDASLVDRVWGLAFVVLAWVYGWIGDGAVDRRVLVVVLVTIWGLRLAGYITWRNWGEGEDDRYTQMRRGVKGSFAAWSLVRVFWLQAILAWIIALPFLAVAVDPDPESLIWLDWLGVAVWGVGLFFEAVGDWQLSRFLADPDNRGTVMNKGLWRYTRHPNYFGDSTVWLGYGLIAWASGAWWAMAGPFVMWIFIVKVSGVALTDERMSSGSSREGYEEYVRRTNAFFPGPPKPEHS